MEDETRAAIDNLTRATGKRLGEINKRLTRMEIETKIKFRSI